MSDNEKEEITEDQAATQMLMERAFEEPQRKFEYLHCLEELHNARVCMRANRSVSRGFRKTAKILLRMMAKNVGSCGDAGADNVMAYRQAMYCAEYYKRDADTMADMIDEYLCYIHCCHLADTLLNVYRPEEDEVDWRKLEWDWDIFHLFK